MEKACSGKMKRRHLKHLNADDRTAIVNDYLEGDMPMTDVASKHHITKALVGRLSKDLKSGG